eukprot:CAMPEP_0174349954 /NCGR_PEP_ID=MMETSP0811_2-20130205/6863_1 /TAXON_ID=73025 ORGANISM="Eutreptiella gymnastica-like, Strain CCMP1594" /NCGR_SAMPLE_ID=MMETSP0811_2 /ASSEMBLY_ACC=CAM_ASM_000667 /LENGTH=105 /DNA_ID=CAMNT_0015477785 /DNA_START=279 /DNA_END=594 /DNA_ORIENTATION=-
MTLFIHCTTCMVELERSKLNARVLALRQAEETKGGQDCDSDVKVRGVSSDLSWTEVGQWETNMDQRRVLGDAGQNIKGIFAEAGGICARGKEAGERKERAMANHH